MGLLPFFSVKEPRRLLNMRAPEPVWKFWRREKYLALLGIFLSSPEVLLLLSFLGAFAKLREVTVGFVGSVRQHGTSPLP